MLIIGGNQQIAKRQQLHLTPIRATFHPQSDRIPYWSGRVLKFTEMWIASPLPDRMPLGVQ